jgi:hypothetical protein
LFPPPTLYLPPVWRGCDTVAAGYALGSFHQLKKQGQGGLKETTVIGLQKVKRLGKESQEKS